MMIEFKKTDKIKVITRFKENFINYVRGYFCKFPDTYFTIDNNREEIKKNLSILAIEYFKKASAELINPQIGYLAGACFLNSLSINDGIKLYQSDKNYYLNLLTY